ncbi:glycosyltransferase [Marinobacter sp. M216]|uniref:Glycosyltransferase n=1 Tax=Marinobacter albus TaxID=3030833 RepID=A0ABT7H8J8_9GAMM|nr:glycosyltransferase [Marinobacter sp. M216]MDK9556659.1 glycosyltransferase [Marinobacter sp. M216]
MANAGGFVEQMLPVITLIATTPRVDLLEQFALPSIRRQSCQPSMVLIVSDNRRLEASERQSIRSHLPGIDIVFLENAHSPGAAGSWNTGLQKISQLFPACYVAIIDDDDRWTANHLATCLKCSDHGAADVVVSGIHVVIDGQIKYTNVPSRLIAQDFLRGNPGWQGSNTFIKAETLRSVGGFTDGLTSCNDRDLAIRVLDGPAVTVNFTGTATVFWQCNGNPSALSAPRSAQKLKGCAQFLQLHEKRMSPADREAFFDRVETLFQWSRNDIEAEKYRLAVD